MQRLFSFALFIPELICAKKQKGTRRCHFEREESELAADEFDGISNRLEALGFFVRNASSELFFDFHKEFHDIQRVSAKIFLEA
jgi:hypothetical protein